jgi:hypothetical protein
MRHRLDPQSLDGIILVKALKKETGVEVVTAYDGMKLEF